MAVVWVVSLVVLVVGVVVVFAEAFSAYRTGGALERRLAELEEGQREILAVLRDTPAPAAAPPPAPSRSTVTLLAVRMPRTGSPGHVEVTRWLYAVPPHTDAGRLRAITADYLASGEVDPGWPSATARWAVVDGRAVDLGAALHGALVGVALDEVGTVTGLPDDLPSALALVPLAAGGPLVTVARVAGVAVGLGTPDPVLTAASFKSLVRSELTDVIGRAIGAGLFADRPAPPDPPWPDVTAAAVAPATRWPFTDDDPAPTR